MPACHILPLKTETEYFQNVANYLGPPKPAVPPSVNIIRESDCSLFNGRSTRLMRSSRRKKNSNQSAQQNPEKRDDGLVVLSREKETPNGGGSGTSLPPREKSTKVAQATMRREGQRRKRSVPSRRRARRSAARQLGAVTWRVTARPRRGSSPSLRKSSGSLHLLCHLLGALLATTAPSLRWRLSVGQVSWQRASSALLRTF